jgi:hypothetical protein
MFLSFSAIDGGQSTISQAGSQAEQTWFNSSAHRHFFFADFQLPCLMLLGNI